MFVNKPPPLHDIETANTVLPPHRVEIPIQHRNPHTGAACGGGRHLARPLVGLGVVPKGGESVSIYLKISKKIIIKKKLFFF